MTLKVIYSIIATAAWIGVLNYIWTHNMDYPDWIKKYFPEKPTQTQEIATSPHLPSDPAQSMAEPFLDPHMFGSTIRLKNEGSAMVTQISKIAMIGGWFDINTKKITEIQVVRTRQILQKELYPSKHFDIDLTSHVIPLPLKKTPKDSTRGMAVYALVLRYKRLADMKPFEVFLPFSLSKDTKTQSIDIFMPLFPSPRTTIARPTGTSYSRITQDARDALIAIYKDEVAQIKVE